MTDAEKKLEETDNAIKDLTVKLAGITMLNVIADELKDKEPETVSYLLNNLKKINSLFEERMK